MLPNQSVIWETDPKKMTPEWATQVLMYRRRYWQRVVSDTDYATLKAYVLTLQGTENIKKHFDDQEFIDNNPILPLPFFEKPKNIIIDKLKKSGIRPYLTATDPTAVMLKDKDRFLLENRRVIESTVNQNRSKLGLAPFKVEKKMFNGNIEDFDKMKLDDQNPSDIDFFFKTFYKLNVEAYGQVLVNSYMELNKVEDEITRFAIDILSVKCICKQDYISPLTGQIKSVYLQPSQVYAIFGRNRDATDASVRGWEMQITVEEMLNQLGDAFSFEKHWPWLIRSINYGSGQVFDGFIRNGITYSLEPVSNKDVKEQTSAEPLAERPLVLLSWDNSYNYKVYFGYAEWDQMVSDVRKVSTITGQRFPADFDFQPTEKSTYTREERRYFKTLCTYYLPFGAEQAYLFGFGDLYHMLTEGQYDEYSKGSISIIREEGLSAAMVARPYIELGNYAYYRMLWAIHRSKPDVWDFSFESIRDIAMKLSPTVSSNGTNTPQVAGAFQSAVDTLIDKFKKKLVMFHTYPISQDGQVMGGGGSGHAKIPGALDALAIQLRETVLEWAEFQIADKLGVGAFNETNIPNPKEGLGIKEINLKQSQAAIGYIPDMVEKTYEHTARVQLLYAQDIIRHKASLPYKFLLNLVGEKVVTSIEELGNVALHRFGIFVNSLDTTASKEEIMMQAGAAQQQGRITFGQYLMLKEIKEPRLAAITFAYYEEKQAKRTQDNLLQIESKKQETIGLTHKYKLEEIQTDGQIKIKVAQIQAGATVKGKELDYRGKVETKEMGINAEPEKLETKGAVEQANETHKQNLKQQSPTAA